MYKNGQNYQFYKEMGIHFIKMSFVVLLLIIINIGGHFFNSEYQN